jgi:hypothetical protein
VIEGMPRPRPPHLQREVTRHGKANWYVRIGKGPRVRIRADFGTPEFDAEYQAAITGHPRPAKGAPAAGVLGLANRALSRNHRVGCFVGGDQTSTREHLRAGDRDRRRAADRQDHQRDHCGRPRTPGKDATSGAPFPRYHARPFFVGHARPSLFARIRPKASEIPRKRRGPAFGCGPKRTWPLTSGAGRSAHVSAFGWMC